MPRPPSSPTRQSHWEQRLALIKRYVGEFRKVLPAVKVGRWYQAETALNKIVDLRIAAEVPLAK